MTIEGVTALNRRVVVRLSSYTLVVTGVVRVESCELPSVWLYETITDQAGGHRLDVETESGHLRVWGADFRLIRNDDLSVLVPPIDA